MKKSTRPASGLGMAITKLLVLADVGIFQLYSRAQTPLDRFILRDILPPNSESCLSPDTFSFQFNPDGWNEKFERAERNQFLVQMNHEDANPDRSWTMRIGTGGHCYSFKGPFGEIIPDQVTPDSLWNDAVMQAVAVNTHLNRAGVQDWYIHQAGPYQRADGLEANPFYSPSLNWDCNREGCSVGGWGQQAHVPMPYKSDVLFFTRYSDCGNGVIEITNVIHNAADPYSPEAAKVNWLNTFWSGYKTSVLEDVLIPDKYGNLNIQYPLQTFGRTESQLELGKQEKTIPYVHDTAGYFVFAQDLPVPPTDNLNKFEMPCSGYSAEDCLQLVVKADKACVQSTSHARFTVRCSLEFTIEVDHGCDNCHLFFTNKQTGNGFEVPHVLHWSIMGRLIYFTPRDITVDQINKILFEGSVIDVSYSTSFRMPCVSSEDSHIKECPINPDIYNREVIRLAVGEDNSCQYSAYHSDKNKKYTVRIKLKEGHGTKDGCDSCKLKLINARTGESVGAMNINHWTFPGKYDQYVYFVPLEVTAEQINLIFKGGDTIIVKNLDIGKSLEKNVGISTVFGKESETKPPEYNMETRLRFGSTFFHKDYTVLVHNPRIDLLPCESFVSRQYFIVDRLDKIGQKSMKWVGEAYKDHHLCGEFTGRPVHLHSDGTRFGYRFNAGTCGNANLYCSGRTAPHMGMIAHFYIKCGDRTYMGPDKYYFAPARKDESQPIQSYMCRDQPGVTPEWKLLGYYPRGSCTSLVRAKYDANFCG